MATPHASPKSSSAAPTRAWALDMANAPVRIKPRRPYTPYNLFYLLERELVVQGNDPSVSKERAEKRAKMEADKSTNFGERSEESIPFPARYKNVVMLPMWYEPNLKEKRKHRKTHGTISFKDLTEIISKNWATIDPETKDYCTRVSEIGRKRYKEQMTRYNASQKIIQLKKEKAAMESAREKRLEQFQQKDCGSPARPDKVGSTKPLTPDRVMSHHAPVVTPQSAYNNSNRMPMFVPSGTHPFQHYGPPPPMPPPMPHSHVPSHMPPAMPMYHQHNQHHHQFQHQHQHHHQHQHQHQHQHHPQPQFSYQASSATRKMSNNLHKAHKAHKAQKQAPKVHSKPSPARKPSSGRSKGRGGVNVISNLPDSAVGVTVDVQVSLKREASSERNHGTQHRGAPFRNNNLSHDDATRLGSLLGTASPGNKVIEHGGQHLGDALLREVPSFDFGDHHSLSSENESDHLSHHILDQVGNQEDNILDLIRGELLPLGLGEDHFELGDL